MPTIILASILATTAFCRPATPPTSVTYAPDALSVPYLATNIIWHIDESVEPPREWAETNIVAEHRAVLNPTAADYFACGWLQNAILPPSPLEGYCVTNTTYEAVETRCVARYAYAPVPPVVPTYSVARLVYYLTERGLWEQVKAALGESIILQAVAVGEFSADNEDFVEIRPAMEAAFGAEVVASALAYADTRNTSALREMGR